MSEGKRYETLYQRLLAHVEDNLLTTESSIMYDGVAVTTNEVMSATCERLMVFLWFQLLFFINVSIGECHQGFTGQ